MLAGARNVKTVASDRFRKFAGEAFDLIVGNLPFVVSPERHFVYRDGGLPADGFAAATVQEAGAHLKAGGQALLLVQWVHPRVSFDGPEAFERAEEDHLAPWVAGNGCHALFLRFTTESIAEYALTWSDEPGISSPRGRAARFARWMRFYESRGIGAISTGLVVLRRAGRARPWMMVQPFPAPTDPCGAEIIDLMDDIASHMRRR